jgi:hypothetical protein
VSRFAIQANLSMGMGMSLSGAVDGLNKRFLALIEASIFPMFPANSIELPKVMPVALLNRAKISHYHSIES